MRKMHIWALCALLSISLAACRGENELESAPGEKPAVAGSSDESVEGEPGLREEPEEPSASTEHFDDTSFNALEEVMVYIYNPEDETYTPHRLDIPVEGVTVYGMIRLVAKVMDIRKPEVEIEQNKGQVILDFAGSYVDGVLTDSEIETVFLNSICATVTESDLSAEYFELRKDGGAYRSVNTTLALDEPYDWAPLKIGEGTEAAFTAIRGKVPYAGLVGKSTDQLRYDIVDSDPDSVVRVLTDFLSKTGDPAKDADTPAGLEGDFVLDQAIQNVQWYTSYDYGQPEQYLPEIRPITASVKDDMVAMKEHVEQAARELYGDVAVTHETVGNWTWHPLEGVYTPPHIGGGYVLQPVIFEYEVLSDGYKVNLAYVRNAMGAFLDNKGEQIPEDKLLATIKSQFLRREVVVKKNADGKLTFYSHHFVRSENDEFGLAPG